MEKKDANHIDLSSKELSSSAKARYALAQEIAGNLSCDTRNKGSFISIYFQLLNRELGSPPFPRTV